MGEESFLVVFHEGAEGRKAYLCDQTGRHVEELEDVPQEVLDEERLSEWVEEWAEERFGDSEIVATKESDHPLTFRIL